MDMQQALAELGVTDDLITGEQKERLDVDGYLVLHDALTPAQVDRMKVELDRLIDSSADAKTIENGSEIVGNLVDKSLAFDVVLKNPKMLACAAHILKHNFTLRSVNCRFALPGRGRQALHSDTLALLSTPGHYEMCNGIWPLDDFTEENGATSVIPGSHLLSEWPAEMLANRSAICPGEVIVTAPAGSVIVINGHTLHTGNLNRTSERRRALTSPFNRRDYGKTKEYNPETLARVGEAASFILGINPMEINS